MKIGIDLDGVVFNTEAIWAVDGEIYDYLELKKNSLIKRDEPRVQEKYAWSEEETKEYFKKYVEIKDFDLVPGAKKVIQLLHKDGHELIVITARGSLSDVAHGREFALNKLTSEDIIFDKYYFGEKNKLETCLKEKIDIMIDDNYHICETLAENNIKVLYFHSLGRKHLLDKPNIKEVYNWGEIYRYISDYTKNNM